MFISRAAITPERPLMMAIKGGPFVMGAFHNQANPPRWVSVDHFAMSVTCVKESHFRHVTGRPSREDETVYVKRSDRQGLYLQEAQRTVHISPEGAAEASREDVDAYVRKLKNKSGAMHLRLPWAREREYAARGRAIDMLALMKSEDVGVGDFEKWADGRFENFVERLEMGSRIMMNFEVSRLLQSDVLPSLYAWKVYGTPSGGLDDRSPDTANDYGMEGMGRGERELVTGSDGITEYGGTDQIALGRREYKEVPVPIATQFRSSQSHGGHHYHFRLAEEFPSTLLDAPYYSKPW